MKLIALASLVALAVLAGCSSDDTPGYSASSDKPAASERSARDVARDCIAAAKAGEELPSECDDVVGPASRRAHLRGCGYAENKDDAPKGCEGFEEEGDVGSRPFKNGVPMVVVLETCLEVEARDGNLPGFCPNVIAREKEIREVAKTLPQGASAADYELEFARPKGGA